MSQKGLCACGVLGQGRDAAAAAVAVEAVKTLDPHWRGAVPELRPDAALAAHARRRVPGRRRGRSRRHPGLCEPRVTDQRVRRAAGRRPAEEGGRRRRRWISATTLEKFKS